MEPVTILAEVAHVLSAHGRLRCRPDIEIDEGTMCGTLTITLKVSYAGDGHYSQDAAQCVNLYHALTYLRNVAQMRALAGFLQIDPAELERLIPPIDGNTTRKETADDATDPNVRHLS